MSFIYKYKTSTLNPFVKPRDILNLAIQNIFYIQSYVESTFTYNPGLTNILIVENSSKIFRRQRVVLCKIHVETDSNLFVLLSVSLNLGLIQ